MSNFLGNAKYGRMSNTSSPLQLIGQHSQIDDNSQISLGSFPNPFLSEEEKQKFILISTLEHHIDRCRRRLLGSFFMRLQEMYNKFLRRRIAVAKLNRLIKIYFQGLKEHAFETLRNKAGKLRRASELPRKVNKRELITLSDEVSTSFEVVATYLKETTPIKPVSKKVIDKAFAAQQLLAALRFVFKEARTKRYAFGILKRPVFLASQPKSFSLDISFPTNRASSFDRILVDKSRNKENGSRDRLLSGIKKLADVVHLRRAKIFALLSEKTNVSRGKSEAISNRNSQDSAYLNKVSQFFSYRQNRRLRSIDLSHMKHVRQNSESQSRSNYFDTENRSSDSSQVYSFGNVSPHSTSLNNLISPKGIRQSTPDRIERVRVNGRNRAESPEQLESLNQTRNSEDVNLSQRDIMIKEKLKKVVLNSRPTFKDKQIEKYLRYEHTFYQVLRVFKGALKRELYYSFENLKNWGKIDPRTHRSFVKILNRLRGRTQQALYQALIAFRDNAKRKQLELMTFKNFLLILNSKKNMVLEKSFVHLQLVLWLDPEDRSYSKQSKFVTPNFGLSKGLLRLSPLKEISPEQKGAGLILQKVLKRKIKEMLTHAMRKLIHWDRGVLKMSLDITSGAEKLKKALLKQGGTDFFESLRQFCSQFSQEGIDSPEKSPSRRKISSPEPRKSEPRGSSNGLHESQSLTMFEPSRNTIKEEVEEDDSFPEKRVRPEESRVRNSIKQSQGQKFENSTRSDHSREETMLQGSESLSHRGILKPGSKTGRQDQYEPSQQNNNSYDQSMGTMIVNQTNPDETGFGYVRFDLTNRDTENYLQGAGQSQSRPATHKKYRGGDDNAEYEDRIRNIETFSTPRPTTSTKEHFTKDKQTTSPATRNLFPDKDYGNGDKRKSIQELRDDRESEQQHRELSSDFITINDSKEEEMTLQSKKQEKEKASGFDSKAERGRGGDALGYATKKAAIRILAKLLEVARPRLQKAIGFYHLQKHSEHSEAARDESKSVEDSKVTTAKRASVIYIAKTLDLILKFKKKINLAAAFHDLLHFSQENSLNDLRRNYSSRIISAQKRQNCGVLGKALDSVSRASKYREVSRAFNRLKTCYQEFYFSKSVKAIKLKSIVQKNILMNLACAFK